MRPCCLQTRSGFVPLPLAPLPASGDDPIEERPAEPPSLNTWDVMVSHKEFYLADDYWQASFSFGGGFRVFFQPAFIQRFAAGDVAWLDEYYRDGEDDDD